MRLSVSILGLLFFPLSIARTACRVMDACYATSAKLIPAACHTHSYVTLQLSLPAICRFFDLCSVTVPAVIRVSLTSA